MSHNKRNVQIKFDGRNAEMNDDSSDDFDPSEGFNESFDSWHRSNEKYERRTSSVKRDVRRELPTPEYVRTPERTHRTYALDQETKNLRFSPRALQFDRGEEFSQNLNRSDRYPKKNSPYKH